MNSIYQRLLSATVDEKHQRWQNKKFDDGKQLFYNFASVNIYTMPTLNNAQLEIIKMFDENQSEKELRELKDILSAYLADKLSKSILKESREKYTSAQINNWKDEHFRTAYK